MLTIFFISYIILSLAYLLWVPRKEIALTIVLYAFVQYAMTLAFWLFQMNTYFTALLLAFIFTTSLLLLWSRNMNYSHEWKYVGSFFSVSQWALICFLLVYMSLRSAYDPFIPAAGWSGHIDMPHKTIHSVIKLSGNLLVFSTFFHVLHNWGQNWSLKKSLVDLGPLFVYFVIVTLLKVFQSYTENSPYI